MLQTTFETLKATDRRVSGSGWGACILVLALTSLNAFGQTKTELSVPLKQLFNHQNHLDIFESTGVSCTECHRFDVKSPGFDPLSTNVAHGYMVPNRKTCHSCHMGKVDFARPNQCSLCHKNPDKLKPADHHLDWTHRHGKYAQMNSETCKKCHSDTQSSCLKCHSQRNTLKPNVHRPNFRVMHSIEARANPASCVKCHSTTNTCTQCHKGVP